MLKLQNTISCLILLVLLNGCALWPYKSDFDCKTSEGLKCQSLYNVAKMADLGAFGPDGTITRDEVELINKIATSRQTGKKLVIKIPKSRITRGCSNDY